MGIVPLVDEVTSQLGSFDIVKVIEPKKLASLAEDGFHNGSCLGEKCAGRGPPWVLVASFVGVICDGGVAPETGAGRNMRSLGMWVEKIE